MPNDDKPLPPEIHQKLMEGCPLLEQYKEDNDARRAHMQTQDRVRRPQQEAWERRYQELDGKTDQSRDEAQRFALESQPELNDLFRKGEAAIAEMENYLRTDQLWPSPEAREKAREDSNAGGEARREAWNNLERVCKTPAM
jgi:hypothetical protein